MRDMQISLQGRGSGISHLSSWALKEQSTVRFAKGKQNLRATCPKGKLEFKFISSSVKDKLTSRHQGITWK